MLPVRSPLLLARAVTTATTNLAALHQGAPWTQYTGRPPSPPFLAFGSADSSLPFANKPHWVPPAPLPAETAHQEGNKVLRALASLDDDWDPGHVTGKCNGVECTVMPGSVMPFPYDNGNGKFKLMYFANDNSEV